MDQRDGDDGDRKVPSEISIAVDSCERGNTIVTRVMQQSNGESPSPQGKVMDSRA